jgi:hypothetical protein
LIWWQTLGDLGPGHVELEPLGGDAGQKLLADHLAVYVEF